MNKGRKNYYLKLLTHVSKKLVIISSLLGVLLLPLSAFASMSFSPASPQVATTTVSYYCTVGNKITSYDAVSGAKITGVACDNSGTYNGTSSTSRTVIYVECNTAVGSAVCANSTIAAERTDTGYVGEYQYVYGDAGLGTMVAQSNANQVNTTSFSYGSAVTKVGTWIQMFMGGGLGLVDALIGWIIALIIFGIIVSLIFRAMRFLHILK